MEKQKLVYILNRDIAARLTIGSPLEAHKSHTLVHYCTGVDVGFENPIFACLEVDYSEADQDPTGEALKETEKVREYEWFHGKDIKTHVTGYGPRGETFPLT